MKHFHDCIDKKFKLKDPNRSSRWSEDSTFFTQNKRTPLNSEVRKSSNIPCAPKSAKRTQKRKTFSVGNRAKTFLKSQRIKDFGKKTLVLDLDETLVHSSFSLPTTPPQTSHVILDIDWQDGEQSNVFVRIRPYLQQFLTEMCKIFEVVIFTASVKQYAIPLVKHLDRSKYGYKVLHRSHCISTRGHYYKDLSKLGRDLKDVIIVDNSPEVYSLNKENGIPIKSWYEDPCDTELYKLIKILQLLSRVEDVRETIPTI